jgi:hypothetical protein
MLNKLATSLLEKNKRAKRCFLRSGTPYLTMASHLKQEMNAEGKQSMIQARETPCAIGSSWWHLP